MWQTAQIAKIKPFQQEGAQREQNVEKLAENPPKDGFVGSDPIVPSDEEELMYQNLTPDFKTASESTDSVNFPTEKPAVETLLDRKRKQKPKNRGPLMRDSMKKAEREGKNGGKTVEKDQNSGKKDKNLAKMAAALDFSIFRNPQAEMEVEEVGTSGAKNGNLDTFGNLTSDVKNLTRNLAGHATPPHMMAGNRLQIQT